MATPLSDENIEKILGPFREAVKIQVTKNVLFLSFSLCFSIDIDFQGDLIRTMKESGVNPDDADFKKAISELKIRKKNLEDQVKNSSFYFPKNEFIPEKRSRKICPKKRASTG